MRTVIIEDEKVAAEALQALLSEIDATIEVTAVLQTIDESVEWFVTEPPPDLVFMDVHLADGSAFAIFEQVKIPCPIVFTTAYDEFALKAFEVNSIDYLLKPIDRRALQRAINKFRNLTAIQDNNQLIANMLSVIKQERRYKSCFLIPVKDKLIPLATVDIALICIDDKSLKVLTLSGKTYLLNASLDEWMIQLDPALFYRANRQYIISRHAISDISVWFGGKLSVNLTVPSPDRILVSKARVADFKSWVAG
ncbi:MAG: LytTR family DNA-binding domain-containing protein [Tannerella sp.]|jgi:two-component system LytT family response regulator|nr:LytTR family DNA-binding domain-containing protein [Tannerella sp.]